MADVSGATNYFPKAEENSVAMTLGGSILAGAATVPVNGMTNYTDGDVIAFTVDPATPSLKQVFTGTKSGANIINAVWTEKPTGGANVAHAAGATVIDYVSATHWDLFQKGVTSSLNQDGSMKTTAVQTALNINSGATNGWTPTGFAPSAVVANGNRSYTLTFAATNLTTSLSPGMRLMTTRTVAVPTQCTSLNGSTQYYTKAAPAGMGATDNITVMGWIKPTAYQQGILAARANSTTDGWLTSLNASGQLAIQGARAGDDVATSYQSVPLNKWVHVAVTMNSAGAASTMYIDGVSVPVSFTNNANSGFLTPTGTFSIGATSTGTLPFAGKMAQMAVFNAVLSQATIQSYMSQGLAGTETSLISAYSFNNSINDLNANANNLTANGSALATNADSPFGGQAGGSISSTLDYGIITSASFSTNTTVVVQVPEGCTIPTSGGVSAVSYSTVAAPYGFPKQRSKWQISWLSVGSLAAINTNNTWGTGATTTSTAFTIPIGEWQVTYDFNHYDDRGASVTIELSQSLSTNPSAETDATWTTIAKFGIGSGSTFAAYNATRTGSLSLAAQTVYYGLLRANSSDGTLSNHGLNILGGADSSSIKAECAYL